MIGNTGHRPVRCCSWPWCSSWLGRRGACSRGRCLGTCVPCSCPLPTGTRIPRRLWCAHLTTWSWHSPVREYSFSVVLVSFVCSAGPRRQGSSWCGMQGGHPGGPAQMCSCSFAGVPVATGCRRRLPALLPERVPATVSACQHVPAWVRNARK